MTVSKQTLNKVYACNILSTNNNINQTKRVSCNTGFTNNLCHIHLGRSHNHPIKMQRNFRLEDHLFGNWVQCCNEVCGGEGDAIHVIEYVRQYPVFTTLPLLTSHRKLFYLIQAPLYSLQPT